MNTKKYLIEWIEVLHQKRSVEVFAENEDNALDIRFNPEYIDKIKDGKLRFEDELRLTTTEIEDNNAKQ